MFSFALAYVAKANPGSKHELWVCNTVRCTNMDKTWLKPLLAQVGRSSYAARFCRFAMCDFAQQIRRVAADSRELCPVDDRGGEDCGRCGGGHPHLCGDFGEWGV